MPARVCSLSTSLRECAYISIDAAEQFGGEEGTACQLAMGEWIPPVEIARIVVFLSRGDCRHLSGATIDINGASYMR